jgi:hypothetical protein
MSENVLKQIPKELWWKIFFILFKDIEEKKSDEKNEENEIPIFNPPYTPYTPHEFPLKFPPLSTKVETKKMQRHNLLSDIYKTCLYWEDITIKNNIFIHLFFNAHTSEFELHDSLYKKTLNFSNDEDKFANVDYKIKSDELNMKIEEIISFRNNDEECIIKQDTYQIIKSNLNPKLNNHGDAIFINEGGENFVNQIQNIYAEQADGVDIETVENHYQALVDTYNLRVKQDEQCEMRHIVKKQTDEEFEEKENNMRSPISKEEFEKNIELLIEQRDESHLFDGIFHDTVTYLDINKI